MVQHITTSLTAAEALVLQNPAKGQGKDALKLTMMELLARRLLELRREESKGFMGAKRKTDYLVLQPGAEARATDRAHVKAVLEVLRSAAVKGGDPTMAEVVAKAQQTFGKDLGRFQSEYVLPALIAAGLVGPFTKQALFVFNTTSHRRTAAGEAVFQQLQSSMEQARQIPSMLDSRPGEAAAMALALGSTLLLVPELRPAFGRLGQEMRAYGGDMGSVGIVETGEEGVDFDMSGFDFDFGAFDTLDSSLDAFDSSFDSSSDSGGGDGGDSGGGGD